MGRVKPFLFFSVGLLIFTLIFSGCGDKMPDRTALLTSGPWLYNSSSAFGTGLDSVYIKGFAFQFQSSELTFNVDYTTVWKFQNGTEVPGEWSWDANETMVFYSQDGASPFVWNVDYLTEDALEVSWVEGDGIVSHLFSH